MADLLDELGARDLNPHPDFIDAIVADRLESVSNRLGIDVDQVAAGHLGVTWAADLADYIEARFAEILPRL